MWWLCWISIVECLWICALIVHWTTVVLLFFKLTDKLHFKNVYLIRLMRVIMHKLCNESLFCCAAIVAYSRTGGRILFVRHITDDESGYHASEPQWKKVHLCWVTPHNLEPVSSDEVNTWDGIQWILQTYCDDITRVSDSYRVQNLFFGIKHVLYFVLLYVCAVILNFSQLNCIIRLEVACFFTSFS